jgi:asparagine synthase (glutamine-hydrolysing)
MGLICGQWTFEGTSATPLPIDSTADASSAACIFCDEGVRLSVRGFPVAEFGPRSVRDSKSVLVWDGRLDNARDLAQELGMSLHGNSEDVTVVAAAYESWKTEAFRKMKGDWAVTVWNATERSLILARDPMGMRPLFYALTPGVVHWSNSLSWLIETGTADLSLNHEYLAGWLAFFPAAHLTPYSGILAVPPSCFVQLQPKGVTIRKYWEFEPGKILRYRADSEYEEHFRSLFTQSVRRRLRSELPILAELSGGMDSSSIVSVADALLKHEQGLTPRLDTLSYYDDNEPNWNERPYFSLVEVKRGREGIRVQLDLAQDWAPIFENQGFAAVPAELGKASTNRMSLVELLRSRDYGAILSGIGGDEFTGGVPTPIPELADLLAAGKFCSLAHQLKSWSLSQRRPWIHLLLETARTFAPFFATSMPARRPPVWLNQRFQRRYRQALLGYDKRLLFWGHRPSFQENLSAVEALRRQLAASSVNPEEIAEKRYPFLDVDFLQFLFRIPREQLVQPGRRRSLMRRALAGIVPEEILNRKRKAYVARSPMLAIVTRWQDLQPLTHDMVAESLGIVSSPAFRGTLENIREGRGMAVVAVQRMLLLERWLRNLADEGAFSKVSQSQKSEAQPLGALRSLSSDAKRVSAS